MIDGEFVKDFFQILIGLGAIFAVIHQIWSTVSEVKALKKQLLAIPKELNEKLLTEKKEYERELNALWERVNLLETRIYELTKK